MPHPDRPGLGTPLEDVVVADFTRLLPGGYATQVLADLGARVVKVEAPGEGDYSRWLPPTIDVDGGTHGFGFAAVNRGKESVALDLKTDEGTEAALRLAEEADVLAESLRPGVMARLGLGWEAVSRRNPDVVYASLSGYGASGPLRDEPGHDVNYQALAGILALTGPEEPVIPAVQVADMGGGLAMATATIAALRGVDRGLGGRWIDMALADVARDVFRPHLVRAEAEDGPVPARGETELAGGMACYNLYQGADGDWLALGALEEKFWSRFCEVVDREDLEHRGQVPGDEEAKEAVQGVMGKRPVDEWVEQLSEAGIPATRVLHPCASLDHPQFQARGEGAPWHPGGDEPGDRSIPGLGEHTRDVLREVGYDEAEVNDLVAAGAADEPEA
jgi:crotonobetainyl-CoA:carnitine CoA-transferase CaiB-like acyl-CoA transferase